MIDLSHLEKLKEGTPEYTAECARLNELMQLEEQAIELREGLPFLYGWKWYDWAREFFESRNKLNFLCAANQISKSSTQIRKCIHWATDQDEWSKLWARPPIQFWYLYPSQKQVNAEFLTKWMLFLPRGKYKDDPKYGWKKIEKNKEIIGIKFNSGVYVFFKTYAQDVQSLQSGTCDAIFCDEELPTDLYDELMFRISASDGYFHMVFTATLGQEMWREVMEEKGDKERLPEAFKLQVSMYDCQTYEDGTLSHWTNERINIAIARCKNHNQVLRRVFGKFVVDEGRKYEQFDIKRHFIKPRSIPQDWLIYAGVDPGSGGAEGHPSAICFVAVRPDFRFAEVFRGWRGDKIDTTSSDVVTKFIEMKGKIVCSGQYYDFADKDFFNIATGMHEPFIKAEKGHDIGEDVINVLFKNDMIFLHEDPELTKLGWELSNLRDDVAKKHAKDDFCDAFRYAVTKIPWDYSGITGSATTYAAPVPEKPKTDIERQLDERRTFSHDNGSGEHPSVEEELAEWADLHG